MVKKKIKKAVKKAVRKSAAKSAKGSKATKKTKTTIKTKKKTVVKKTRKDKKLLVIASGDECFWVNQGPVLENILDLRDLLLSIEKEQFEHHVNRNGNDFAVWVEYVLEDKDTAMQMKKIKTLTAMIKTIEKALKGYNI